MIQTETGAQTYMEAAQAFQARHVAYLSAGDIEGLTANCYTSDARLHSFRFRAQGTQELAEVIGLYAERLRQYGDRTVSFRSAGKDFIWQEVTLEGASGRVEIYEFKFLRDGKVYLQLLSEKRGSVWLPDDFDNAPSHDAAAARELHHRYIDYQSRGNADAMVDEFFTADARLVTARAQIEGRENLRAFFRSKFEKESGFHLASMRNITGDEDYVWFEATAASSAGSRMVYDVMLLHEGRVSVQLVGTLEGSLPAITH